MTENNDFFNNMMSLLSNLITYLISIGLMLDHFMQYLDKYAGAFGVLIAFMSFLVSWYYAQKKAKR